MNRLHRRLCASSYWKAEVNRMLPWVLEGVDLGSHVLEVGPGPGVTTEWIAARVPRLTAVEIDSGLAEALSRRVAGRNVAVLCEDATALSLPEASFDAAVCLTMLHHVPTPALQDRLLGEVARVLRPGATFAGADTLSSPGIRLLHVFDTLVPVDPATFAPRLERAGFTDVRIDVDGQRFRFQARAATRRPSDPSRALPSDGRRDRRSSSRT